MAVGALPEVSLANDRRPSPRWHIHAYGALRERHMTLRPESAPTVDSSQDRRSARHLIDRIVAGDQAAFQRLCVTLSDWVWQAAIQALPQPLDARAVTRATFLEVWHLAGHHVHDPTDVRAWVTAISTRRINERLRTLDAPNLLVD